VVVAIFLDDIIVVVLMMAAESSRVGLFRHARHGYWPFTLVGAGWLLAPLGQVSRGSRPADSSWPHGIHVPIGVVV